MALSNWPWLVVHDGACLVNLYLDVVKCDDSLDGSRALHACEEVGLLRVELLVGQDPC